MVAAGHNFRAHNSIDVCQHDFSFSPNDRGKIPPSLNAVDHSCWVASLSSALSLSLPTAGAWQPGIAILGHGSWHARPLTPERERRCSTAVGRLPLPRVRSPANGGPARARPPGTPGRRGVGRGQSLDTTWGTLTYRLRRTAYRSLFRPGSCNLLISLHIHSASSW